uniref:Uncharacterized protein n=1 Tax=Rhizophora mucronata TaxID=61149 RepID=A0A2P2N6E9_RHIMU
MHFKSEDSKCYVTLEGISRHARPKFYSQLVDKEKNNLCYKINARSLFNQYKKKMCSTCLCI